MGPGLFPHPRVDAAGDDRRRRHRSRAAQHRGDAEALAGAVARDRCSSSARRLSFALSVRTLGLVPALLLSVAMAVLGEPQDDLRQGVC